MKSLVIHDTRTGEDLPFVPKEGGKVHLFVCGPTVYAPSHLGHAKIYLQFDFISRFLRYLGFDVEYLQNITDIDDKILHKATSEGCGWKDVASRYEELYLRDMSRLRVTSVTRYARATDHIDAILSQVERLVASGHAYTLADGIYFDVKSFPRYGQLSGRTSQVADDAVSRIDDSKGKRSPADFCLWKLSNPNEVGWNSRFGFGRPGWHIEDTAITEKFFGSQYDIHGGAIDLIFPHHEAEVAQMEALSGLSPMVRYWMHGGFLTTADGKMSKSGGELVTIDQILETHQVTTVRFAFLSQHYRSQVRLSDGLFETAAGALKRLRHFERRAIAGADKGQAGDVDDAQQTWRRIVERLLADFDTPGALSELFDFVRRHNANESAGVGTVDLLTKFDSIWDVLQDEAHLAVSDGRAGRLDTATISALVAERERMRSSREFDAADAIRAELARLGVELEDTGDGTRWTFIGKA